mmetsp:Transcript_5395/g.6826  ORF Transcript_5395/g.6826 Transcript_5395/m.6826 type:complete len:271 (+) Transcript_5395:450-1262(+)
MPQRSVEEASAAAEVEAEVVEHQGAAPPMDLITQTDADGKPIRRDIVQEKQIEPCGACIFRFFCCLSLERNFTPLLPDISPRCKGKKSLVLDLDETLVHSSFEVVEDPDFVITVNLKGAKFDVYVIKRPGVDEFLNELAKYYEIIIFTASLPKYAVKVLDVLDKNKVIEATLFRDSCTLHEGNFIKDLSLLGRSLESTIIVDNSPYSYQFQPANAIGVSTFTDDKNDRELFYCKDFLLSIHESDDVRDKLKTYKDFIHEMEIAEGKMPST